MRIFYAAGATPNGSLRGSQIWHYNLYLPLCDLGHTLVSFDFDLEPYYAHADPASPAARAFIEENRPRLEQALLAQIEAAHRERPIDVFFSYFYAAFVRPAVIQEIRRMGIVTVNWYCNASYQFHLVEVIAPAYDFCLVPEKFRLEDYRRVGAQPIYCQEAANPNFYKPYPLAREFDVTFVGAQYGDRAEYVAHLARQGIDVRVWGPGWQALCPPTRRLGRLRWQAARAKRQLLHQPYAPIVLPSQVCGAPLSDEAMIQTYSRGKISLGFSNVGETHRSGQPIKQVRLRDFEAPMSGAFYMVEHMTELAEFFEVGREIVCYHDRADLLDKVKYYLQHDSEREQIRLAGHRRAVRDHTWHNRFQSVFAEMGLA